MRVERERRYRLSDTAYQQVLGQLSWSPPEKIIDVMMGYHGLDSMDTDGWVVRLRTNSRGARMQVKKRRSDLHEHCETDLGIDSLSSAVETLSLMGLSLGLIITRIRRETPVGEATLMLDRIHYMGSFLEVEERSDKDPELPPFLVPHLADINECGTYGDLILERLNADPAWATMYWQEAIKTLKSLRLEGRIRVMKVTEDQFRQTLKLNCIENSTLTEIRSPQATIQTPGDL